MSDDDHTLEDAVESVGQGTGELPLGSDREAIREFIEWLRQDRPTAITQPVGNCDGSGLYAYDPTDDNGRGARLAIPCPGCRACR